MEARDRVLRDAVAAGALPGDRLEVGGTDAEAYADAVATYLGLAASKATDMNNRLVTWKPSMDQAINLFKRQAIPMTWDFPETPPLSNKHAGGFVTSLGGILRAFCGAPQQRRCQCRSARRLDAAFLGTRH